MVFTYNCFSQIIEKAFTVLYKIEKYEENYQKNDSSQIKTYHFNCEIKSSKNFEKVFKQIFALYFIF